MAGRRRDVRRSGAIVLAIFLGSTAAAILLQPHQARSTVVTVLIGTAVVCVGWWLAYAASQDKEWSLSLAGVADEFAGTMQGQWQDEAVRRGLNDPYPLEVRWAAVDTPLAEDWESLVTRASRGAARASARERGTWAAGPGELAEGNRGLADVLPLVPTGRLLILGEAGAGKTVLMVQLLLELLRRRHPGGQVPVLVPLDSWNPPEQNLGSWLAEQLTISTPALAAPAPAGFEKATRAGALLADGLILPILDGLDEIPEGVRELAIKKINEMQPGLPMLVTCRTEPTGTGGPAGQPVVGSQFALQAAALQLCPLDSRADAAAVRDYLSRGHPHAAARWEPVVRMLGTRTPLGQALTTPLMISLARLIYSPPPDERTGQTRRPDELPDPAELCDRDLTDRAAVEHQLYDTFVPAAYQSGHDRRWPPGKAEGWLRFLACQQGFEIEWWQLWHAVPAVVFAVAAGLWTGLAAGIATAIGRGLGHGIVSGVAVGAAAAPGAALAGGLTVWLAAARWQRADGPGAPGRFVLIRKAAPALLVGISAMLSLGLAYGLSSGNSSGLSAGLTAGLGPGLAGLAAGTAIGAAATVWRQPQPSGGVHGRVGALSVTAGLLGGVSGGLAVGLPYGPGYGVVSGVAMGLAFGLAFGLERRPPLAETATPAVTLARDRRTVLAIGVVPVVGTGLVFGLGFPILFAISVGLIVGLGFGFIVIMLKTAWPLYALARIWLSLRGKLPWSLMTFLAGARDRGVLRQVGPRYQFRHQNLQQRLATQSRQQELARF
jgi:hypothetical protein